VTSYGIEPRLLCSLSGPLSARDGRRSPGAASGSVGTRRSPCTRGVPPSARRSTRVRPGLGEETVGDEMEAVGWGCDAADQLPRGPLLELLLENTVHRARRRRRPATTKPTGSRTLVPAPPRVRTGSYAGHTHPRGEGPPGVSGRAWRGRADQFLGGCCWSRSSMTSTPRAVDDRHRPPTRRARAPAPAYTNRYVGGVCSPSPPPPLFWEGAGGRSPSAASESLSDRRGARWVDGAAWYRTPSG
jgi:hypothetical protein